MRTLADLALGFVFGFLVGCWYYKAQVRRFVKKEIAKMVGDKFKIGAGQDVRIVLVDDKSK